MRDTPQVAFVRPFTKWVGDKGKVDYFDKDGRLLLTTQLVLDELSNDYVLNVIPHDNRHTAIKIFSE